MTRVIQVTAKIAVPTVPNFLLYDGGKLAISDVSDDDLRRLGHAWTESLLERAAQQRKARGSHG